MTRARRLLIESLEVRHLLSVTLDLKTSSDTGASDNDNITQKVGPSDITYSVSAAIGGIPATPPITSCINFYVDGNPLLCAPVPNTQERRDWGLYLTEGDHVIEAEGTYLSFGLELPSNFWTSGPINITVDSTAPTKPSRPNLLPSSDSSGAATSSAGTTSIDSPLFSGTGEANAIIRLYANGDPVGEGTVTSGGTTGYSSWRVAAESLADGEYEITAQQEDLAGNVSFRSEPFTLIIDTQPPPRPAVDLLAADDTGASAIDNYTKKSKLRFQVTAELGTTVNIYDGGDTIIDTFTSNGNDVRSLVLTPEHTQSVRMRPTLPTTTVLSRKSCWSPSIRPPRRSRLRTCSYLAIQG